MISKSLRTVQKYENGEIEINISTANDIARVLDVSASYILGNDDMISSSQLPKSPQTFYEKQEYQKEQSLMIYQRPGFAQFVVKERICSRFMSKLKNFN